MRGLRLRVAATALRRKHALYVGGKDLLLFGFERASGCNLLGVLFLDRRL